MTTRRDFLKTIGTGTAAATVAACSPADPGQLIPYLVPPHDIVPGRASWYATTCRECPAGCGVLARVREGRVVKLEGNPEQPVNRGALCPRGQAALQGLYNPDRVREPQRRDGAAAEVLPWEEALEELASRLDGARIAWIGHHVTASLDRLVGEFLSQFPGSQRIRYEPLSYEAITEANQILFGRRVIPSYDLSSADLILSFGADFLETWLSNVSLTRQYGLAHKYQDGHKGLQIHIAPRCGLTGENADRWIAVLPGSEALVAAALVAAVLDSGSSPLPARERDEVRRLIGDVDLRRAAAGAGVEESDLEEVAGALVAAPRVAVLGGGAAAAGERATAIEVASTLLNYVTGNLGHTVRYDQPLSLSEVSSYREVLELTHQMEAGQIDVLFLHHTNPVYSLPPESGFAAGLDGVPYVVSFNSYPDETTGLADLLLPDHTPLESWGDHEPAAGVFALQQPVMRPLFDTRATGDVLLDLTRRRGQQAAEDFSAYLRSGWRQLHGRIGDGSFQKFWEQALRQGGWSAGEPNPSGGTVTLASPLPEISFDPARLEGDPQLLPLLVHPTIQLFDGRGANRPWLQELPDAITKATWGNWVEMHPDTAEGLGLQDNDGVRLTSPYASTEAGLVLSTSIRPGVVAMPLGQGHREYGRYAAGRGTSPLPLLPAKVESVSGAALRLAVRVSVESLGRRMPVIRTQMEDSDHGRGIAQVVTLSELEGPRVEQDHESADMYEDHSHPDHRWGMVIDLDACIGCGACEVACAAENNIAIAGAEAVSRGREMAWLRIERYRSGAAGSVFLPMLCQHCDRAPCEPVCPVYATYHNPEGLNAMIYNRCVGTRYCSNNCPYKVRRFNWSDPDWPDPLPLQLNPDVTPRSKGVMEKCTFCVQRIQAAKQAAADQDTAVVDGDIVPACGQSCPVGAIVFGDLKDPDSRVQRLSSNRRGYRIFEDLNTRPAITYLRRVRHELP